MPLNLSISTTKGGKLSDPKQSENLLQTEQQSSASGNWITSCLLHLAIIFKNKVGIDVGNNQIKFSIAHFTYHPHN